jgi:formylglycine-generating enzyme required for sulfatase activity
MRRTETIPPYCVSCVNAKGYVDWLSRTTGKSWPLLSEAEFEYAARRRQFAL